MLVVQVKCERCQCIVSLPMPESEELLRRLDNGDALLPRPFRASYCVCRCHQLDGAGKVFPRLHARTLEFDDETPF